MASFVHTGGDATPTKGATVSRTNGNSTSKAPNGHAAVPRTGTEPVGQAACAETGIVTALVHIKALLGHLQESAGFAAASQRLAFMLNEAENLRVLCALHGWAVPETIATSLVRLLANFREEPENLNASATKTASDAVTYLQSIFTANAQGDLPKCLPVRVMIIDDDAVARRVILSALNVAGLKVTACSGGQEALDNLKTSPYDIVFTDILMPRLSGFTLLKQLRELPQYRRTPVVFVTALADFNSVRGTECDLIAKPIIPAELVLKAFTFGLGSAANLSRANGGSGDTKVFKKPAPQPAPVHDIPHETGNGCHTEPAHDRTVKMLEQQVAAANKLNRTLLERLANAETQLRRTTEISDRIEVMVRQALTSMRAEILVLMSEIKDNAKER